MNWLSENENGQHIFQLQNARQKILENWYAGRAEREHCRVVIARINHTIERLYWLGLRSKNATRKG